MMNTRYGPRYDFCFQPTKSPSKIEMDLVRAVASLEFVSERGLNSTDQGPYVLANQVFSSFFYQIKLSGALYVMIISVRSSLHFDMPLYNKCFYDTPL